ncbi:serpin-ZX [Tanacetum coccineum]
MRRRISNEFSMYIFLQNRKDGLQNLLVHFLSNGALFYGDFDLKEERLNNVWIPKFEISCAFEPEDVMKQMGLTLPFKRTNTELSGIVHTSHLSHSMLYVSILQKAVIKVDEKGTEAAACTRMLLSRGGCPLEINFVADHPLMFMIREDTSKAVLFVGSVLNPYVN